MLNPKESEKPRVIECLYEMYKSGKIREGVVTSDQVLDAIKQTGAKLGKANPANFLKDIVRSVNANSIWPESLRKDRISARQRYGEKRVLQFVKYAGEQKDPFPDRFVPNASTPVQTVASASMSFVARRLGRKEETWLTQIVVNLRLIECQLSVFSPLRARLRDVTHLQMGMKTQPEIDAVFLASFGKTEKLDAPTIMHMLVSCEAKQINQRILEDQIREQVAKSMQITASMKTPAIDAVKPMAIAVTRHDFAGVKERAIYVVEFEHIDRAKFDQEWLATSDTDERLYTMPLNAVSQTVYRIMPPIAGLNA
jgi:hypothetical protein